MQIKHRFSSKQEAIDYLEMRGWCLISEPGKREIMAHPSIQGNRFFVHLRTGKWRIERI